MTMRYFIWISIGVVLLAAAANAKNKEKMLLPDLVLKATTVTVVIQPGAGEPMTDPAANRRAVEEVEKALMRWGRFRIVMDALTADLVIAVKRGTSNVVQPTISGGPIDKSPGTWESTAGQTRTGGRKGRPPDVTSTDTHPEDSRVHSGMEIGSNEDSFQVYQGGVDYPLDRLRLWRYAAKDALRSPDVTAVAEFRKAVEEAEKQAAQRQQQKKKNP
jgi:hypothetical protein